MFAGVPAAQYVALRLFLKDVKGDYTRSAFGTVWDFADPLVLALIFYFLAKTRVLNAGAIDVPYAVFVTFGILLYQTFADAVLYPLEVTKRSRNLVTQLRISPEALLLSTFYRVVFMSGFRIAVMLGVALVLGAFSPLGFLAFLALYPTIILAGMAFGVLLAPFNTIYNDVARVTRLILNPLRYASPVLYAIPPVAPFSYVYAVNPIASLIDGLRSVATVGVFGDPWGFVARVLVLAVVFLFGWFVFHLSVPVLAERA